MLEFYKIPAHKNTPEYPEKEIFIDSLSWVEVKTINLFLKKLAYKDLLHYYEDTRLNLNDITKINQYMVKKINLKNSASANLPIEKFIKILKTAIAENMELLAYCD